MEEAGRGWKRWRDRDRDREKEIQRAAGLKRREGAKTDRGSY